MQRARAVGGRPRTPPHRLLALSAPRVRESEVAYNDTRGHGQFKATRPERKEKKGVALLP